MRARRINLVLRNRAIVVNALRGAWVLLVLWFEIGVFRWSLRGCRWPDAEWKQARKFLEGEHVSPAHLLIVADTQVLDSHSLPSVTPLLRRLVRFVVDSNLRKSWVVARRLHPHGVVFLGDMINGGRYAREDEEYEIAVRKFRGIFILPPDIPTYYVVGNHDVGLGRSTLFSQRARARFQASFNVSQPNRTVKFGNHTLVLLDAPGLVEEDYRRVAEGKIHPLRASIGSGTKKSGRGKQVWTPSRGGPMEFVKKVDQDRQIQADPLPLILFSHIPFARPDRSNCGLLREGRGIKSYIQKGAGPGYQNLLGKATSTWTLETLSPIAVFTADDHDYCEITHSYLGSGGSTNGTRVEQPSDGLLDSDGWEAKTVKETTVKTFSIRAGVRRPGLHLLSLWNPLPHESLRADDVGLVSKAISSNSNAHFTTAADTTCLLPDQTSIYLHGYLPFILISLAILFWLNLKAPTPPHLKTSPTQTPHSKSLPFFDTPENARFFETPPTIDGEGYNDRDDTPRGSATGHTTLLSHQSSILHPTVSGLRTPLTHGSSPFSGPLLSPVLLPPDMDGDGDSSKGSGGDDDTPTARRVRAAGDEEKGLDLGSPRFISSSMTPKTPTSPWAGSSSTYPYPSSPTPESSGKWEAGTWRRGSSQGPRSLFGHAGRGLGLVIGGNEREREKANEVGNGWRRVHGGGGFWSAMRMQLWNGVVCGCWTIYVIMAGRPLPATVGGSSFWRRYAWDSLCTALPSWVVFGAVSWWYIW